MRLFLSWGFQGLFFMHVSPLPPTHLNPQGVGGDLLREEVLGALAKQGASLLLWIMENSLKDPRSPSVCLTLLPQCALSSSGKGWAGTVVETVLDLRTETHLL